MALEIRVHRGRCIGSKTCLSAAAGVFRIDHENIAVVVDPGSASDADILAAAEGCPTGAITVSPAAGATAGR